MIKLFLILISCGFSYEFPVLQKVKSSLTKTQQLQQTQDPERSFQQTETIIRNIEKPTLQKTAEILPVPPIQKETPKDFYLYQFGRIDDEIKDLRTLEKNQEQIISALKSIQNQQEIILTKAKIYDELVNEVETYRSLFSYFSTGGGSILGAGLLGWLGRFLYMKKKGKR